MADRAHADPPADLSRRLLEHEARLESLVERLLQGDQLRAPSAIGDPIRLTEREAQVLQLLVTGRTNRQIGAELHLVAPTVRNHLSRIYRKLGVTTRTLAAVRAIELGLSGDARQHERLTAACARRRSARPLPPRTAATPP